MVAGERRVLSLTLRTLRTRWVAYAGTFTALALGVGVIAAMGLTLAATLDAPHQGPQRFARAPVVVRGADSLKVRTANGVRQQPLAVPRPVSPALAAHLATVGRTVADRTVQLGEGRAGHPWSVAAFAPYRLASGRAPRSGGEVVVTGQRFAAGDRLTLAGRPRTVVGTVAGPGFEQAVFFTDAEAARLAPRIDNLVVDAPPAAVRAAVASFSGTQVLTGDARRAADPDPDGDHQALIAVNALVGTAAGVTGFVSVFVVASAFAFSVAQRGREFGLLRTAGATPRQIRRSVLAEAAAVAVPASTAGCVLGALGAPRLAAWLVNTGAAPEWFTVGGALWPYQLAFWTGLTVALAGVWSASRRAGRVSPLQALRDAQVDIGTLPPARRAAGLALLLGGVGLAVWRLVADPAEALHRKTYTTQPMLLITAFALLAPMVAGPLVRLLGVAARASGASGMLARENAAAGVRRTAAVAAPVLITVALAGSLLGTTATISAARAAENRSQTAADFVVVPQSGTEADGSKSDGMKNDRATNAGSAGFDARTAASIARIPGTDSTALTPTAVYVVEDGVALIREAARAADPAGLAAVERLPVAAGSLADLDDHSIVVTDEWQTHTVGRTVEVWLGDGAKVSLRIAAVLRQGTGGNGAYVTARNAEGLRPDRIDVKLRPGADPAAVAAALRAAVSGSGAHVLRRAQWLAASAPRTDGQTRSGFLMVLGIALLYSAIALANTMVMATSDRVRDLTVLRLAGATTWQVLRSVAAEALLVVAVGAVLGAAVAGLNLLGVRAALGALSVPSPVIVPWQALGVMVGGCALIAVTAAVLPARWALRRGRTGYV
jgi:putative ABC transport system permease protein